MEALKPIKPIMAIANSFAASNPAVSYFCEMWAITKAMEVRDSNPDVRSTINQALMEIMEAGEKHKAMVQGTPPYEDGMGTVSAAAMHFFQAAQGPDLQGQGGREACKNYMQAMILFEVTRQFQDPMPPPTAQNHQFATARAAAIRKAITAGQEFAAPPAAAPPPPPAAAAPPGPALPSVAAAGPVIVQPVAVPVGRPCWEPAKTLETKADVLEEARRQSLHASNALAFQDVQAAVNCTRQAIALLEAVGSC